MLRTWEPSGVILTNIATTDTKGKLIQHVLWKQFLSLASSEFSAVQYGSGALQGCVQTLLSKALSAGSHNESKLAATPHPCPQWGPLSTPHCYLTEQLCLYKEHLRSLNPSLSAGIQSLTSVHCNHLITPPWWPTFHCPSASTLALLHQLNYTSLYSWNWLRELQEAQQRSHNMCDKLRWQVMA